MNMKLSFFKDILAVGVFIEENSVSLQDVLFLCFLISLVCCILVSETLLN